VKKTILVTAAAVGMLMLGGGSAQADPAPPPPPAPGLSPEAAQAYQRAWEQWQSAPCGLSVQPNPLPHLAFKQC
jgi:hypothetical protein